MDTGTNKALHLRRHNSHILSLYTLILNIAQETWKKETQQHNISDTKQNTHKQ